MSEPMKAEIGFAADYALFEAKWDGFTPISDFYSNAIIAGADKTANNPLLVQGTNFLNFMGKYI